MQTSVESHINLLRRGDYKTIRELLFEHIRDLIISGKLEAGRKLVEEELAEQFKVSRTPVREALRKLEIEGLVRYQPRRGVVVTGFSRDDLDEIYAARAVLEGLAARLAAERATDAEITELGRRLEQMNRASEAGDFQRTARIHTRFDDVLYRIGHNRRLYNILSQFSEYIEHCQMVSMERPGRADEIRVEHNAMYRAIAERDPNRAEQMARLHVTNARRAFFGEDRLSLDGDLSSSVRTPPSPDPR